MKKEDKILDFLKPKIERPKKILEVGPGKGDLSKKLYNEYGVLGSLIYCIDTDGERLALGKANENLKEVFAVYGNIYDIEKGSRGFKLANLNPAYVSENTSLENLQLTDLEEDLSGFDCVIGVNVGPALSFSEISRLPAEEFYPQGMVPLRIISYPAKSGAYVFDQREIACKGKGMWGGKDPKKLSEEDVAAILKERIEEGKAAGLEYVSDKVMLGEEIVFNGPYGSRRITGPYSIELGVLFKKL